MFCRRSWRWPTAEILPKEEARRIYREIVAKVRDPALLEFLGYMFFQRVQQAILWKPRGGGGSLAAAILIWLMMVYRQKSFIDHRPLAIGFGSVLLLTAALALVDILGQR
mgnify:CR=1 FL=1